VTAYLLDTNIVSLFVRGKASDQALAILKAQPVGMVYVSSVSRAEILYGLTKAGMPPKLTRAVAAFFHAVVIPPWGEAEAQAYAGLRTAIEKKGISIAPLDLMIASQALASRAVLVTNDAALKQLTPWMNVEDWTEK
jgi:tRNA(fMet)-specific endonuclease VapC